MNDFFCILVSLSIIYVILPVVYHVVGIYARNTNLAPHNDDFKKNVIFPSKSMLKPRVDFFKMIF